MKINPPGIITARLLPGVKVPGGAISITYAKRPGCDLGRCRYQYHIDVDGWEHSNDDLQSGGGGGDLRAGLLALFGFLDAAAESDTHRRRTGHPGENSDIFPARVNAWASRYNDELYRIRDEIEQTPNIFEE